MILPAYSGISPSSPLSSSRFSVLEEKSVNKILLTGGLCLAAAPAFAQRPAPSRMKPAHKPAKPSRAATAPIGVTGRVTLPNAKPAVGAAVYLRWGTVDGEKTLKLETDAQGAFRGSLSIPPELRGQMMQATALIPGQSVACQQAILAPGGLKLNFCLTPGVSLTGRLIRPDGKPAANVPVSVASLVAPMPLTAQTVSALAAQNAGREALQEARQAAQPLLVTDEIAAQFHAETDAAGLFTLTGLPAGGSAKLKPGAGLLMSDGSMGAIKIQASGYQNAGLLTAVRPGQIKVHLVDRQTNKPLVNGMTAISPVNTLLASALFDENGVTQGLAGQTNEQGNVVFKNVRPGDYQVFVEDRVVTAHVNEGETAPPIRMTLRQGALRGRLLDWQGRPLAHVVVTTFTGTPRRLTQESRFAVPDEERRNTSKTRSDGSFTISQMEWGSPSVWIRAAQGNDLAEWTGSPDKLGSTLTLKMRRNATVTVTGHLIDPERRPLAKQKCATLHWLDSPRSTWFATMHQISSDAKGNFRVEGLERGEAFSVVTSPGAQDSESGKPFESPRFTTVSAGQEQNLGEVMVHPVQDAGEIMTIYGDSDPAPQDRLSGFLPSPSAADSAAARQALARYQAAQKSGDTAVLHELTSRLSPGWSANRRDFLEHCTLTIASGKMPLASESVRALPLVPRAAGASLLRFSGAEQEGNGAVDLSAAIRQLDMDPDFVFFAEPDAIAVGLTGILHKEGGAWRVLAVPAGMIEQSARLLSVEGSGLAPQDKAEFTRMAPPLEASASAEARQAAQKYLKFWSENRAASMQALTALVSPLYSADLTDYKARLAQREDEGICPLTDADTADLQPVDNLTVWDQKLLTNLSGAASFNPRRRHFDDAPQRQQNDAAALAQGPASFARRGDAAFFRYNAAGQWYLISLLRYDGQWVVLEPAFAM